MSIFEKIGVLISSASADLLHVACKCNRASIELVLHVTLEASNTSAKALLKYIRQQIAIQWWSMYVQNQIVENFRHCRYSTVSVALQSS